MSDSPIPMFCEHGDDRATCVECADERAVRLLQQVKIAKRLDGLRKDYTVALGGLGPVEKKASPSNRLVIRQILADWEKASGDALPFPESEKDRLLLLVAQEVTRD